MKLRANQRPNPGVLCPVSAAAIHRTDSSWLSRPTGAAAASLAAVCFFIGILGLAFLPWEARRLADPQYVSVTHCVEMGAGRPTLSLFWSIARFGKPGWQHYLAAHSPSDPSQSPVFLCPQLQPLSLAKGIDADHALIGNWDGSIYSIDVRKPTLPPECIGRQPDGAAIALAAAANGQYVLSQSAFSLHAWDAATQTRRWQRSDVAPYCFSPRPDRAAVIVGTNRGELLEVDLYTGRTLRSLARLERPLLLISLSADGMKLAALLANDRVTLLDSQTGQRLWNDQQVRSCGTAAGRIIAFSPCGTMLVTAGREFKGHSLAVWSVATGDRLCELGGHEKVVIGAAFTQSGRLRSWGADGTVRDWSLIAGSSHRIAKLDPPPLDS
jgi:WD40 repeat protein